MIFEHTPFSESRDMLSAIDEFMDRMKSYDWVILRDHDVLFCQNDWYVKVGKVIDTYGQGAIYTCWTNRVKCKWQVDDTWKADDLQDHWDHDIYRKEVGVIDRTDEDPWSGFLMVISKKQWLKMRKFLTRKLLGLDNEIHEAAVQLGMKIIQIDMYVYHRYRFGIEGDKSHLKRKAWECKYLY